MRITQRQRTAIVEATREIFGEHTVVRLFGSRADDARQGGDIDLYIDIPGIDPLRHEKSQKLSARICTKLGDIFPIDIVVKDASMPDALIYQEGMRGIPL